MVNLEITTSENSGAFRAIADGGIEIFHTRQIDDLTARFQVTRGNFPAVKSLCQSRGDTIRLVGRDGVYWVLKSLLRRKLLLAGGLLLVFLALFLPSRVLFIRVEGNETIPANQILEAAESCGICFGASRRQVRSEKVKNALLERMPELGWVGVNTQGCTATISVWERTVTQATESETQGCGNIVAVLDGVITECTATQGNLLCAPGQAVLAGEVLISGYIDCGICIQAVQAEGEVYAETRRNLTAVVPSEYQKRAEAAEEGKKISLIIGKNRINLWKDSRIWDTTCGRIYEEYYLTLPGGFRLPVALAVETYTAWDTEAAALDESEGESLLAAFARDYLKQQMVAGRMDSEDYTFTGADGSYRLFGSYICTEMIGKRQRLEIGEYDGKNG